MKLSAKRQYQKLNLKHDYFGLDGPYHVTYFLNSPACQTHRKGRRYIPIALCIRFRYSCSVDNSSSTIAKRLSVTVMENTKFTQQLCYVYTLVSGESLEQSGQDLKEQINIKKLGDQTCHHYHWACTYIYGAETWTLITPAYIGTTLNIAVQPRTRPNF